MTQVLTPLTQVLAPLTQVRALLFLISILSLKVSRTFLSRRGEITGEWRKIPNEELIDRYCSSNTIRVIKLRRMRWAVDVARMGERRGAYWVLVGKV